MILVADFEKGGAAVANETILIVEDSALDRKLLETTLKSQGFPTTIGMLRERPPSAQY